MNELIYKQDAIKTIKDTDVFVAYHEKDPTKEAVDRAIKVTKGSIIYNFENLSSAEPRKKGKWILGEIKTGAFNLQYQYKKCSECGWESSLIIPRNFCPNCGADMREDKE